MALPVTISLTQFPDQNYFHGPFIDGNGNVYLPLLTSGSPFEPEMYKATDPTDSFSEQDAANRPNNCHLRCLWTTQRGTVLHIGAKDQSAGSYRYSTFNTSDAASNPDTWQVTNEEIENVIDASGQTEVCISIISRSDGTVVVIYNGDEDSVMGNPFARVDYNIRNTSGVWGGPITLVADEKAAIDWFGSVAVLDTDNNMTHLFLKDDTNEVGKHRSLSSADSLSSIEDVDIIVSAAKHIFIPGFYTLDGTTHRIRIGYLSSNDKISLCRIDDDGTPATTVDISDNTAFDVNGSPAACLAVDGTTGKLVYSNNADQDLFDDTDDTPHTTANWGTDNEFLDAVTINRISCNVINRNGQKLAMVYDNAGTIQYNEKDIAVAGDQTITAPIIGRVQAINSPTIAGTGTAIITGPTVARPQVISSPTISGSGSVSLSPSPIGRPQTINAPTLDAIGSAPISPSPITRPHIVNAPTIAGTGQADPVVGTPISRAMTINAPIISGSGTSTITGSVIGRVQTINEPNQVQVDIKAPTIARSQIINAPTISGSGTATITGPTIARPQAVNSPSISGSGPAPITAPIISRVQSVVAPVISTVLKIEPSPVGRAQTINAPAISGTGTADITGPTIARPQIINSPTIAGTGSASISPNPIGRVQSVVAPTIATVNKIEPLPVGRVQIINSPTIGGTGSASITVSVVGRVLSINAPSISTPVGDQTIIPTPLVRNQSVVGPQLGGTRTAIITGTVLGRIAVVNAPSASGSGSAPISSTPVSRIQVTVSPVVTATGAALISPDSVVRNQSVVGPQLSGSSTAIITGPVLGRVKSVVTPILAPSFVATSPTQATPVASFCIVTPVDSLNSVTPDASRNSLTPELSINSVDAVDSLNSATVV